MLVRGQKIIAAIAIKSSLSIHKTDLSGLYAFRDEHPDVRLFVVGINQMSRRLEGDIDVLDYKKFFEEVLSWLARE